MGIRHGQNLLEQNCGGVVRHVEPPDNHKDTKWKSTICV
jgi:hypothetical protein